MLTVLSIIGCIFALMIVPFALVLGFIGFWIGGGIGAAIGVVVGFLIQGGMK